MDRYNYKSIFLFSSLNVEIMHLDIKSESRIAYMKVNGLFFQQEIGHITTGEKTHSSWNKDGIVKGTA